MVLFIDKWTYTDCNQQLPVSGLLWYGKRYLRPNRQAIGGSGNYVYFLADNFSGNKIIGIMYLPGA
jgi:hypothetical protein